MVVDRVRSELARSSEFEGEIADELMVVVSAVVYFLAARLDHPKSYLREDGKGADALEDDLQDDLFDWLRSGALTAGLPIYEATRFGGGRVDIVVVFRAHRVVSELKRELHDSTREAMEASYSQQAGSYSASDYPVGLVIVLDLSEVPPSTPQLAECVWIHRYSDPGGDRLLVFFRVPGRLVTPSAHTK